MPISNAEWLVGLKTYWVEIGKTIDAVVVSETAVPDMDPTTNWNDIGDVLEGAQFFKEEDNDDYKKVGTNGWETVESRTITKDGLNFRTRQMSELAARLALGAAAEIEDDTAFEAFADKTRQIQVFLLFQGRGAGTDTFRLLHRAQLAMEELPEINSQVLSPALRATFQSATPNDAVVNPTSNGPGQILADAS